jgi:hypothetical protein
LTVDSRLPRFLERNTVDGRHEIDAVRWNAELENSAGLSEVRCRDTDTLKSELFEGGDDPAGIVTGQIDEQVEIFRVSRFGVVGNRIGANHNKLNAVPEQAGEQFFEVLRHDVRS